jgi:hypothetical protein
MITVIIVLEKRWTGEEEKEIGISLSLSLHLCVFAPKISFFFLPFDRSQFGNNDEKIGFGLSVIHSFPPKTSPAKRKGSTEGSLSERNAKRKESLDIFLPSSENYCASRFHFTFSS